jgi:thiol-disulfide isomerase/thioredoxin
MIRDKKTSLKIIKIIGILMGVLIGCTTQSSQSISNKGELNTLKINLDLIEGDSIAFNDLFNTKQISSYNDKLPKYYKNQLKNSGLNDNDSVVISTWNSNYNRFYFEMYKQGFITREEFIKRRIDSTIEVVKPEQKQLLIASKFINNEHVLIFDKNNNKDFSDDKSIYFNKNFRILANDSSVINNIPILNFKYWNYKNRKVDSFNRKFIAYPSLNDYRFSYTEDEVSKKSRIILKLKDYWSASIKINKKNYDVAIQGFYNSFLTILIKPDSIQFNKSDYTFNENFSYKIKDSIELGDKIFVIDSITNDVSRLILKPTSKKSIYGFRTGQKIKNFKLDNLRGEKIELYTFLKNKEYTLLDFWGTWCKPCVETIPDLNFFYSKNYKKVNLLSIAYDKNVKKVKDFVKVNDMKWNHSFFEKSKRNGIIRDLNITNYPTLILIDANQKIIYRGSGTNALKDITKILSNY